MRRFAVTIAAATALVAGAPIMGASVGAAPMVAPAAIRGDAGLETIAARISLLWIAGTKQFNESANGAKRGDARSPT